MYMYMCIGDPIVHAMGLSGTFSVYITHRYMHMYMYMYCMWWGLAKAGSKFGSHLATHLFPVFQ